MEEFATNHDQLSDQHASRIARAVASSSGHLVGPDHPPDHSPLVKSVFLDARVTVFPVTSQNARVLGKSLFERVRNELPYLNCMFYIP